MQKESNTQGKKLSQSITSTKANNLSKQKNTLNLSEINSNNIQNEQNSSISLQTDYTDSSSYDSKSSLACKSILKNSFSNNNASMDISNSQSNSTMISENTSNANSFTSLRRDQFGNEITSAKQHKITFDMIQQINLIESYKEYYNPKKKRLFQKEQIIEKEEVEKSRCKGCTIF